MKKLNLTFHAHLDGLMEFEVSDDFTLLGKKADEIWEELCEYYPDQVGTDILNEDFDDLWGMDLGEFTIENFEVNSIWNYSIEDKNGKEIEDEFYINNSPYNQE